MTTHNFDIPVFSLSKFENDNSILLPHVRSLSSKFNYTLCMDLDTDKQINETKNNDIPFEDKKNKIIWAGSIHHGDRIKICNRYFNNPSTLFYLLQKQKQIAGKNVYKWDIPHENVLEKWIDIRKQLEYKYLLMIDGWSTPCCEWKMISNSLCFKLKSSSNQRFSHRDDNIIDYYYYLLKDNINYVSVDEHNLIEKIEYFNNNIIKAKQIIKNSQELITNIFNKDKMKEYVKLIIEKYCKIIH